MTKNHDIFSAYKELRNLSQAAAINYSKTCVKRPLKKDKTKVLMTNGSLVKV